MKQYDTYKPSGIEWLGDIPEHWEVKRVKDSVVSPLKYGANEAAEDDNPLNPRYIRITDFSDNGLLKEETFKSLPHSIAKDYLLNEDDILFARSGATVGKTFIFKNYNGKACFAGYLIKVSLNKKIMTPSFLYFFSKSYSYDNWKNFINTESTIQNISAEKYNNLLLPFPPLSEQTAIANYLDTKTAAIDRKIELLTAKVDKYKALRRSLINETVCRGLNPNAPLKDSGIEWIGMIPAHWEIKRMKSLGEIETSSVDKKTLDNEALIKLVNYTDIYGNTNKEIWNNDNYMIVSANEKQLKSKKLRTGDVLFTPSSETIEDIGVSAVVMEDLNNTLYSYHILRFKFYEILDLKFKKYMLNNDFVQYYFSKSASGTTRKILGLNIFWNLHVILPPLAEQIEIGQYLDEKTTQIDTILTNIGEQINKLTQLRKTLINDVVTGKIKVTED